MDLGLSGKNALVTGAGRGLGLATADRLAAEGATVFGTSRDESGAKTIAERFGTIPVVLDVTSADSIADAFSLLDSSGIEVDLLVNNAGINIPRPATEVTEQDWDTVLDTNLKGPFLVSREAGRRWIEGSRAGSIVNIASQAGIVAIEERAAYGASKAGMIHLTKTLALEWGRKGIRVNAVAPTFVRTELTASTLERRDWADELLSRIPLGRFGEVEDIPAAVAFLLGAGASLITGHTLVLDGGYSIW